MMETERMTNDHGSSANEGGTNRRFSFFCLISLFSVLPTFQSTSLCHFSVFFVILSEKQGRHRGSEAPHQ